MIEQGKQDEIEIKQLLKFYQLDVIAKFVFALELNSFKDKDHPFARNVQRLVDINYKRIAKAYALSVLPKFVSDFFKIQTFDNDAMEFVANTTR